MARSDRRHTHSDPGGRVNRLVSALTLAGAAAGDRVAFLAPNIPALPQAQFSVPAAGAVLVTINTRLRREEAVEQHLPVRGTALLWQPWETPY